MIPKAPRTHLSGDGFLQSPSLGHPSFPSIQLSITNQVGHVHFTSAAEQGCAFPVFRQKLQTLISCCECSNSSPGCCISRSSNGSTPQRRSWSSPHTLAHNMLKVPQSTEIVTFCTFYQIVPTAGGETQAGLFPTAAPCISPYRLLLKCPMINFLIQLNPKQGAGTKLSAAALHAQLTSQLAANHPGNSQVRTETILCREKSCDM